jgi:hypothetical protein
MVTGYPFTRATNAICARKPKTEALRPPGRRPGIPMRVLFVTYLVLVVGGLAYMITIGLIHH